MNEHIKKELENGNLILFLGSGASKESKDQYGKNLLDGDELASFLAKQAGYDHNKESLQRVYSAVKTKLGERLNPILEEKFKYTKPSKNYRILAKYIWPRIYTINIDDAFDNALFSHSPQKINKKNKNDNVVEKDITYDKLEYIKLNGSIDKLEDGLIFSTKEYAESTVKTPHWYKELANDYFKYNFLFIGTKLNEPLFYHQIERYKMLTSSIEQRSYVLTPEATDIEKDSLLNEHNIEHISASLSDFVNWLTETIPEPIEKDELFSKNYPAFKKYTEIYQSKGRQRFISLMENLTPIERKYKNLSQETKENQSIRNFYKGFKPRFNDIIEQIPAELHFTKEIYKRAFKAIDNNDKLIVIYGPAGSGKTTALMQTALRVNDEKNIASYFINNPPRSFYDIIVEMEEIHENNYVVFYDKLDLISSDLRNLLEECIINKGIIIGSESQNIWVERTTKYLYDYCASIIQLSQINEEDAKAILTKLKEYGPWTRLSKLTYQKQISELLEKSKRQLLIGLFEATSGIGYEQIIENEYNNINNEEDRFFLILVGLATMHKINIRDSLVQRGLNNLNFSPDIETYVNRLSGIIFYSNNMLFARHSVYINHLIEKVISKDDLFNSLLALLKSYTVYQSPIIINVSNNEGLLFKKLFNHEFLKNIFNKDLPYIFKIYESFEKHFENDGLFWLQYGLSLRDFGFQQDAYEKISIAYIAYQQPHIEHALAQQELIIADQCTSKESAYSYLNQAIDKLNRLDYTLKNLDTYPIVTLSEGHTQIINKFEGFESAKDVAIDYANKIQEKSKTDSDYRLRNAWTNLTNFVHTGQNIKIKY